MFLLILKIFLTEHIVADVPVLRMLNETVKTQIKLCCFPPQKTLFSNKELVAHLTDVVSDQT